MGLSENAGHEMKARLRADLRDAMKASRPSDARLIRALVAAIDNAEAPPLPQDQKASNQHRFGDGSAEIERLGLDAARVRAIIEAEIREREDAAAEVIRLGRPERAEALRAEASLARRYID